MFIIFAHYSTRPICDVSMNLFCWPPSVDIFNILHGFLWQPLLITDMMFVFQGSVPQNMVKFNSEYAKF